MHASASSRTRNGNASTKFEFRGSIALKLRIARSRWELAKNGVVGNFDASRAVYPEVADNAQVAIVFNYDAFGFEAWLAGRNWKVQRQYWELFKDSQWPAYRVVTPAKGIDSILECDLATDLDLDAPDALTASIETATVAFIDDIERFLA